MSSGGETNNPSSTTVGPPPAASTVSTPGGNDASSTIMASVPEVARLGDYLVENGALTRDALEDALRAARPGERVGSRLVTLGLVDQDTIARGLAAIHGVHAATEEHFRTVDESVIRMVPPEVARTHCLFPLGLMGESPVRLGVAMLDPRDEPALQAVADATGLPLIPAVAPEIVIRSAIADRYSQDTNPRLPPQPVSALSALSKAAYMTPPFGAAPAAKVQDEPSGPDPISMPEAEGAVFSQFDAGIPEDADPGWDPYEGAQPRKEAARDPFQPPEDAPDVAAPLVLDRPSRKEPPNPRVRADKRLVVARQSRALQIGVCCVVVLVVGAVVALPFFVKKEEPVSGPFKVPMVELKVSFPNNGWMYLSDQTGTREVAGATLTEAVFFRGGTAAKPEKLLRISSVQVPMAMDLVTDERFEMILRGLEQEVGNDIHVGYTLTSLRCWRQEGTRMVGECSGVAGVAGDDRYVTMFFWPADYEFVWMSFMHHLEYERVENEFAGMLESVYYGN